MFKQTHHFQAAILAVWLLGIAVFVAMALMPSLPPMPQGFDKILHAGAFLSLMVWPVLTFAERRTLIGVAIALVAAGAGVEGLQSLIPGRESSSADMLANLTGISLGFVLGMALRPTAQRYLPAFAPG